jgi:hypothetical protein
MIKKLITLKKTTLEITMNLTVKNWEDLPPGVLFKTRREADGPGVLVDPRDWSEVPFDVDEAIRVGEAVCAGTKSSLWSIPKKVESSPETELD